MARLQVAPSIDDVRSQSMLELIDRLDQLDLAPILVCRLDSAPDSALPYLAWQFDMFDPRWQLASTSGESIDALTDVDTLSDVDTLQSPSDSAGPSDFDTWRTLLTTAIPLHRIHGTPASIRQALAAMGFGAVSFLEGQASWGGTTYPPSQGWAVFRVLIQLGAGQTIGSVDAARAVAAINFFKPARCLLDALVFVTAPLAEAAPAPTDVLSAPIAPLVDVRAVAPRYDAHYYHIGITYGANEPVVADSGVVANGVSISAKG